MPPFEIKLDLDPKMIEKHLVEAIVNSSMGEHIKKSVNEFITQTKDKYGKERESALEVAVREVMRDEVRKLILAVVVERKDELHEKVKELLTDDVVTEFIDVVWKTVETKIRGY